MDLSTPEEEQYRRLEERVHRRRTRLLIPLSAVGMAGWLYMVLWVGVVNGLAMLFGLVMFGAVIVLMVDIHRLEQAQGRWLAALDHRADETLDHLGYREDDYRG